MLISEKHVDLQRGCRQGDQISYIFALSAEMFVEVFRGCNDIKGINTDNKIYMFTFS